MTTDAPHPSQLSRRGLLGLAGSAVAGTTLASGLGPATAAGGWHDLIVITANIGRDHLAQREPAIRAVRHGVTRHGKTALPLVGFQEIGEDPDTVEAGFINEQFGKSFTKVFNRPRKDRSHRVPIVVPPGFEVIGRHDVFVHEGKKKVTPPRFINEVLLRARFDPKLRIAFLNTHYVAGAWNADTHQGHEAWRRRMWNKHYDKHRERVAAFHQRGIPVVWTGDVNRTNMPNVHRKERRVFQSGIDQIRWVPGDDGTRIRLRDARTIDLHVDTHDARVGVFQVRRG